MVTSSTQMSLLGVHSPTVKRRQSVAETMEGARRITAAITSIFFAWKNCNKYFWGWEIMKIKIANRTRIEN